MLELGIFTKARRNADRLIRPVFVDVGEAAGIRGGHVQKQGPTEIIEIGDSNVGTILGCRRVRVAARVRARVRILLLRANRRCFPAASAHLSPASQIYIRTV